MERENLLSKMILRISYFYRKTWCPVIQDVHFMALHKPGARAEVVRAGFILQGLSQSHVIQTWCYGSLRCTSFI